MIANILPWEQQSYIKMPCNIFVWLYIQGINNFDNKYFVLTPTMHGLQPNKLRCGDAYTLQNMVILYSVACCLFGAKSHAEPMLTFHQLELHEHMPMKFCSKFIFLHIK